MFGGAGLGSFHSDVLNAEPADEEGKIRLVEEIKNRAKGSISSRNYPEAIQLYNKAIELKPCDAILYANRSMCHLQMSNGQDALSDAEKAIEYDNSYAKAYFRKGNAQVHLKQYKNAKTTFEQGLALAPGDKSFIAQLDKLQTMPKDAPASTPSTSKAVKTTTRPVTEKPKAPKPVVDKTEDVDNDDKYDGGATSFRGYKKTADGRVTTFFNNDLDEETKALIGDIAPKKIDPTVAEVTAAPSSGSGESVWNKAGTWEERVHTPWALERLKELLQGVRIPVTEYGGGTLYIKSATLTGDAQVTMARGRVKHIYDFSASGDWVLEMEGADDAAGTYQIEDISGDREYEIQPTITKKGDADSTAVVNKYVKNSSQSNGFHSSVTSALLAFHEEFMRK
mmetsp:Transcript_21703/g.31584  ORF Transcript_21703/g.31584 Transcript_21703/m.31584 type:complete len:395 (-) Transcript_21703:80-1264(-)